MLPRLAFALALALGLAACGPSAENARATNGLQGYLVALRGTDPRPVYNMLSADQRKGLSYEQWSKQWNETKAERELRAEHIEKSLRLHQAVDESARLQFADGRTITLARASKGWRLNQALLGRKRADQPGDALTLFANALRERNVDNLLQILSKRHRTRIETELQTFFLGLTEQLASKDASPYLLGESRAELTWNYDGVRYKVVLIKEDDEWLIDDVHMGPDPTMDPEDAAGAAEEAVPPDFFRRRP